MKKAALLAYGGLAYVTFVVAILYLVGFVGDILVPRSVDAGRAASVVGGVGSAVAVDLLLIALFAIQHSVMARPGFKEWWTSKIPEPIERSTYVLFTTSAFALMFLFWRPIPETVWHVENPVAMYGLYGLFWLGWFIALISTFLINHFDLFGLRQVQLAARDDPYEPLVFKQTWLYRRVRHPINLGFLIAIWATPLMTWGHLLFSLAMTLYIVGATTLEERDLIERHGDEFRSYRQDVAMLIPHRARHWK